MSELPEDLLERAEDSISQLRAAVAEYKNVCYANSLGAESMVLTDLIWGTKLNIEIFSIDTGRLYPETYDLIERVQQRYGRALRVYYPDTVKLEHWVAENGINGFRDGLDQRRSCCGIRKVEPPSPVAARGLPAFGAANPRAGLSLRQWNGTANTVCTK
jgi:phosphoadenosine phosphosulfate reductase